MKVIKNFKFIQSVLFQFFKNIKIETISRDSNEFYFRVNFEM